MVPHFTELYSTHQLLRNAVFFRCDNLTSRIKPNGASFVGCQLAKLSPFGLHVRVVVGQRAKEQMSRIATRRVVASMQHRQAIGDDPSISVPRKAMREVFRFFGYETVAGWTHRKHPYPAPGPRYWLRSFFDVSAKIHGGNHAPH